MTAKPATPMSRMRKSRDVEMTRWIGPRQAAYFYMAIAPVLGAVIEGSITTFAASVTVVAGALFHFEAYKAFDQWKQDRRNR